MQPPAVPGGGDEGAGEGEGAECDDAGDVPVVGFGGVDGDVYDGSWVNESLTAEMRAYTQ